ncbi:MAG: hypothetical protein Q9183_005078 [Haloplaca sp. 2 TL-2023]
MSSYRHAPLSTGHDYRDPPGPLSRLYNEARFVYTKYIAGLLPTPRGSSSKRGGKQQEKWKPRSLLSLPSALILCWVFVLWWGEVGTFRRKVDQCDWKYWERWPENASPHHLVLVADPQLVDPHTYPGRPWPLSTITRHHTDYYMRKSFSLIQETLDPTTVFFLGDLFDGGREWLPPGTKGSDPRWRNYGEDYWIKEYKRFGNIFFNKWAQRRQYGAPYTIHNHRIMASLPGNHDLGLGNGIKLNVRKRFNTFFGEGNSIDIVGNHTFISLDTVSLSAKGQPHPPTGSNPDTNQKIWGPAEDFLADLKTSKHRLMNRALRTQNAHVENDLMFHAVLDVNSPLLGKSVHVAPTHDVYIPSILLTHVPLYRAKDTPCGPLRERFPPTSTPTAEGEYIDKDPPNAIKVEAGIQYQNVLTPEISNEIIEKVEDVEYVFSGDDHDYCEVVHRGYTSPRGGIREITVKSFSWAMGVRKPGFLLVSLWNPLEENEDSPTTQEKAKRDQTVQTHLCLLPDQLSIFIRYVVFLVLTLFLLLVRAIRVTKANTAPTHSNGNVLPLTAKAKTEPPDTSAVDTQANGLTTRSSVTGRTVRTASPSKGYGYPGSNTNSIHDDPLDERWSDAYIDDDDRGRRKDAMSSRFNNIGTEFRNNLLYVAVPVLAWYWYLVSGW